MSILFTRSDSILSQAIRKVTGEPVSHCAIRWNHVVIHSNLYGVNVERLDDFRKHSEIVYEVDSWIEVDVLLKLLADTDDNWYDIPGLFYSGLVIWARSKFPWMRIPKQNLWQVSGMYLCTEFVSKFLYGEADSLITPYGLYRKLTGV